MTLSELFVVASGGVTGREHRRAERDGQDGQALIVTDHALGIVVTDGCSSGRASEVGARLGAAFIAALVVQCFRGVADERSASAAAANVASQLVQRLEVLARSLDPAGNIDPSRVGEGLLFGYLAAVATPDVTIVFGVGDGVVLTAGAHPVLSVIDPGPDNAPPYAAYGLLGAEPEVRIHFVGQTASVDLVAVATDGLVPLTTGAPSLPTLFEVAEDVRYVANPSLLRKRLLVLAAQGCFSDDATLAVLRRRPA